MDHDPQPPDNPTEGPSALISSIFSGRFSASTVIGSLLGSDGDQRLRAVLEEWLWGVGYWRANIRTYYESAAELSYWHRDPLTQGVFRDRLVLPFFDLDTRRFRDRNLRGEIESLWYDTAKIYETTSYQCIQWLANHEYRRRLVGSRPVCVVHPGEFALGLLLTEPGLLAHDPTSDESRISHKLKPVNTAFIKTAARDWVLGESDEKGPLYFPDIYREMFLSKVASRDQILAWLESMPEHAPVDEAARRFHRAATHSKPDIVQLVRSGLIRFRLNEWAVAGSRSIIVWPLLRAGSDKYPEGLQLYALVAPQPDVFLSEERINAIVGAVELLFQHTISGELLRLERQHITFKQAHALHRGLVHELNNLLFKIQLWGDDLPTVDEIYDECQSTMMAADKLGEVLAVRAAAREKNLEAIWDEVVKAFPWKTLDLRVSEQAKSAMAYQAPAALEYVLIELGRNAYKHGIRESDGTRKVYFTITTDPDANRIVSLTITNTGALHSDHKIDTDVDSLPDTDFKGRYLVAYVVKDLIRGRFVLSQNEGNVVAHVECRRN